MEIGVVSKNQFLTELVRSPHAALNEYLPTGQKAFREDPEFGAHLIAYDAINGQVRDAHIALPVVSLSVAGFTEPEFIDNSLAHLAKLTPRELVAAYKFAKGYIRNKDVVEKLITGKDAKTRTVKSRVGGWKQYGKGLLAPVNRVNLLDRLVARYLRFREADDRKFERNVIQFRSDMERLYFLSHTKPGEDAKAILYDLKRPAGSALAAIRNLGDMEPMQAAAAILQYKIPFLMLFPILKEKAKSPVLLMAIVERMSASELQTNMASLEKLGVREYPETRAALEAGLGKIERSKKTVLKTSKAVEKVQDQGLKSRLAAVQERQVSNLKGLEGRWLVLSDASSSMRHSMDISRVISGHLARMVKEQVGLVFFNDSPRYFDVTGKTIQEIAELTRNAACGGYTSIGCGLLAALERGFEPQGIVVVSDGGENKHPRFVDVYASYCRVTGSNPPVYFYHVPGDGDSFSISMQVAGQPVEYRELANTKVDEYSLQAMVETMGVKRYSILDTIMETPLLTVDHILGKVKEEEEEAAHAFIG